MPDTSESASRQSGNADGGANDDHLPFDPVPPRPQPVTTLRDALPELRRPFAPPAVKFKVQSHLYGDRGLMVTYVDARLVVERLDLVCGGSWTSQLTEFAGGMKCSLTLFNRTREDVGKGGFEKASASDALKRAAVLFGVGASLYATPTWILKSTEKGEILENSVPTLRQVERKGKMNLWITPACESWLRDQYSIWLLTSEGERRFGQAFDHGAAGETVGDVAAEQQQLALDDEDEASLAERKAFIANEYREAVKAGAKRSAFPKGQFDARLRQANTSDELFNLATRVAEFGATAGTD